MSRFTAHAAAATATLLAALAPNLQAQPEPSMSNVPLPRLQSMVLHCDLHPGESTEGGFTAAFCAHAAGELRERAFDGDPERLLGWLRAERSRMEVDDGPAALAPAPAAPTVTADRLKTAFLQCDRLSRETALDSGTAGQCSVVYEALKQQVFGGDFERLLAWWRTEMQSTGAQAAASAR